MYKMTDEHKRKIGEANKRGTFIECFICSKKFWASRYELKRNYPRKCCSHECFVERYRKTFIRKGNKNPSWKYGSWVYIKREILLRDNHTCKVCGLRDEEIMEVDHIKEKIHGGKNTIDNAQCLCPNCHARKTIRFLKTDFRKSKEFAGK